MAKKPFKEFDFDFMSRTRIFVVLTSILVTVSIGALAFKGLNFGIDFTGGTVVELAYDKPPDLDKIRSTLERSEFGSALVQKFGSAGEVLVRLPPAGKLSSAALSQKILDLLPGAEMRRIEFVGPQVGEELTQDGVLALIYALGGIFVYVMLRFTRKFALGAIIATVHDVIITVGFFAVTRMEFDLTVLAAVLAVVGYSLNDTIVVFDRVRENLRRIRKGTSVEIINKAINQTLTRTLITSGETMIAVIALFVFGGELLRGFSTALIIGIVVGTYSSIYVATATVVALGITRQDLMPVQKEGAPADNRP